MHLNEGFTKVVLDRTIGVGQADGGDLLGHPNRTDPTAPAAHRVAILGDRPNDDARTQRLSRELIRAVINNFTIKALSEHDR